MHQKNKCNRVKRLAILIKHKYADAPFTRTSLTIDGVMSIKIEASANYIIASK